MLISLHVKNLALIDETEVFFGEGLNILTGETGAGKSVIMGSINLALGAKADKSLIRSGKDYALIELVFRTDDERQVSLLEEMEIPPEEDGIIVVMRKLMPERSLCKVNGVTVSQKQLRELASLLLNIHGQHENQTLLNTKKYSLILDEYAGSKAEKQKEQLAAVYGTYLKKKQELEHSRVDEKEKAREIALASFEVQEIREAELVPGEDEFLEEQFRRMVNSRKIASGAAAAYDYTAAGQMTAADGIGRALRELKAVTTYDDSLNDLMSQLMDIESLLNDFNRSLAEYQESLEFEAEEFERVENRLNRYNRMKDKYGNTVEEILRYYCRQEERLEHLEDYDLYISGLKSEVSQYKAEALEICHRLSEVRREAAKRLQKELSKALQELNFLSVAMEIQVISVEDQLSSQGYDEIDFLISLNPGEPMKSISRVASGGELSRIMLALKAVMADKEEIRTLIFDEIDAGISGKTAWKVSEKMALLGKEHQLLCITHLPQIAAMADHHFVIEKKEEEGRSVTGIREIQSKEVLEEIARLLGGETVTDAVLANAQELKDLAEKTKAF